MSRPGNSAVSLAGPRRTVPVAVRAEVVGSEPHGDGRRLLLAAPELPPAEPGQFLMVGVAPEVGVLPRPYWVDRPGDGRVELSVTARGPGSRWLAARRTGDVVDVVGPLGRPFPLPAAQARRCVLVGDAAAPPLSYLARVLRARGVRVEVSRTPADLGALLAGEPAAGVYAAGPRDLLAAASGEAAAHRTPCHVAVTATMACGTGLCATCAVPVLGGEDPDGRAAVRLRTPVEGPVPDREDPVGRAAVRLRACVDGPVLDGGRVDWSRWLAEEPVPVPPPPAGGGRGVATPLDPGSTPRCAGQRPTQAVAPEDVDLHVSLGPVRLANPLVAASGTAGSGRELADLVDVTRLGAVVAKTVTLEPRQGLPGPRAVETAAGLLNAIGLANPGGDRWRERDLPALAARGVPLLASIAGRTVEEYGLVAARLRGAQGLLAVEANISCPNVEDRGRVFACRPAAAAAAIAAAVAATDLPVFAKLTADVTDITEVAAAVREAGAAGVTVANTLLGLAIDVETQRPRLGGGTGGLSGPAIKPVSLRAVAQVARALPDLPIIGLGGVRTVEDVVEYVLAGATAVAVGTATFARPGVTLDLSERLGPWLAARGHRSIAALRGQVRW